MSIHVDLPAVLVGHRGFPQCYPENSLVGIKAALEEGADAVEIDVQASADGEPMVCHDLNLYRVAKRRLSVSKLSAEELMQISVHEPKRFKQAFEPCPLPHLRQVVALVAEYTHAVLFVELKEEIFIRYSRKAFLDKVLSVLAPLKTRFVIISFDLECLRYVQELTAAPVGWVLRKYNRRSHHLLQQQPVDIVICDHHKLPSEPTPLWPGPWLWFIYDITDPAAVQPWRQRGVRYIETWDVKTLIQAREATA